MPKTAAAFSAGRRRDLGDRLGPGRGERGADVGDPGRLVRLPRCGTGARYGASVSTSTRSSGALAAAARTSSAFLNETIPLNERYAPSAERARGLVGTAGEAVEHGAPRTRRSSSTAERVVPRVARVDHERAVELVRRARSGAGTRPPASPRGECS